MGSIINHAFRSILISCGLQFAVFQLLDMAIVRQRKSWPAYLFMVAKTFLLSMTSQIVASRNSPVMSMANIMLNMLITAFIYWLHVWIWSDDALHTLLISIVAELITSCLFVFVAIVNWLEGRPSAEVNGLFYPLDLLIPVLVFGGFFFARPVFRKIMRAVGKLYLPHRKLLWLPVMGFYIFNHIPAFFGDNVGTRANSVFYIEFILMSAGCCLGLLYFVSSQFLMIRREKESISIQLGLIERRAEITSRIRKEIEESRHLIQMQMAEMEQMAAKGEEITSAMLDTYLTELHQSETNDSRGIYCPEPLVDEILSEIQEKAEAKGMQARIAIQGYDPENVAQEDLSQLLYCTGFAAEGDMGTLELSITSSGEKLIIRLKAPRIRLSHMRSLLVNQIVHAYGGSLIAEHMRDGQFLYAYLNGGKTKQAEPGI